MNWYLCSVGVLYVHRGAKQAAMLCQWSGHPWIWVCLWTRGVWDVCCIWDLLPLPAQEKEGMCPCVPVSGVSPECGSYWGQSLVCGSLGPLCACDSLSASLLADLTSRNVSVPSIGLGWRPRGHRAGHSGRRNPKNQSCWRQQMLLATINTYKIKIWHFYVFLTFTRLTHTVC